MAIIIFVIFEQIINANMKIIEKKRTEKRNFVLQFHGFLFI